MAEPVNEIPFGWNATRTTMGYDWNSWLDGQVWRLVQGVDFHEDTRVMQRRAYSAGNRRDEVARVRTKTRLESNPDGAVHPESGEPLPIVVLYIQAERTE